MSLFTSGRCRVSRTTVPVGPEDWATVDYRQRDDGPWLVRTSADDGFWRFADGSLDEHGVRVLIFKKWCAFWGEPDALTDRA